MHADAGQSSSKCAHQQMVGSTFGTVLPVSTYVEHSATCFECYLFLQVVEEFKPGWVDQEKDRRSLVHVTIRPIYTVRLLHALPHWTEASHDRDTEFVGEFQYFRRSKEEPFYEAERPNGGYYQKQASIFDESTQSLEVMPDSSSPAAFERASKWLSHCLANDEACEMPNQDFAPRRLISVGSGEHPPEPRLVEPSGPTPYACLSYCWGSDVDGVLTTTMDNLKAHCEAIPMSSMPRGIQDAVRVCRGLGIPNLWVDSLCIVQDDHQAWLADASEMDRIYLHSRLTIAALEPATCKIPFLGKQSFGIAGWQRRLVPTLPVGSDVPPLEIFLRKTIVDQDAPSPQRSLDKRGWCLQEGILPNRRLCFDGDEMTWECLGRKICECGHVLWRPKTCRLNELGALLKTSRPPFEDHYRSRQLWMPYKSPEGSWMEQNKGYKKWRQIITEYSQRSLSRPEDKLRAVSGLAKLVRGGFPGNKERTARDADDWGRRSPNTAQVVLRDERNKQEEYLAGLWSGEFLFDLCWMVVEPSADTLPSPALADSSDQAMHRRVPTWSWASLDRAIEYKFDEPLWLWKYDPDVVNRCIVRSVTCEQEVTGDDTSAVTSGRAVLTGALVSIELEVVKTERGFEATGWRRNCPGVRISLDSPRPLAVAPGDELPKCRTAGVPCKSTGCCEGKDGEGIRCFRLFSWETRVRGFSRGRDLKFLPRMGPETWFLVLAPSPTVKGAFERIGIGNTLERSSEGKLTLFEEAEISTVEIV